MTGPEHYREAERLVGSRTVTSMSGRETYQAPPTTDGILQAQVHATLALAAATAMATAEANGVDPVEFRAWGGVCGVQPDDGGSDG